MHGLSIVVRAGNEQNTVASLFPFVASGVRKTLILESVRVWQGELEAQVTAQWGDGEVTFIDAQYVANRAWYEAGRRWAFALAGLAYRAAPASKREWNIKQHPDQVAWMNRRLKPGEQPHEVDVTIKLDGAALFLPVTEWDTDDYSFHAPIQSVEEFKDWLGQDGWRVRATVMRFGDEDADLDIFITRRVWVGDAPPRAGQDIEGRPWLQGCLWMPK